MVHEALKPKPKIPRFNFTPEGYPNTSSEEYLDDFLEFLRGHDFDPQQLFFSGFDGADIKNGHVPKHSYIFGMNESAWRDVVRGGHELNPANYAEGGSKPCIGVYDSSQLASVVHGVDLDSADYSQRTQVFDIELLDKLADLPPDTPVSEAVVHVDYPNASPTDALVGLVNLHKV